MNVKKIFLKAPAECFLKLLDDKERDVGFNDIVCCSLARQHLITGRGLDGCKSELGIYFDVPDNAIEIGMEIFSKHRDSVKFDIERKVFLDFYISNKEERDYVLQIAFMALNTMIGQNRTYCRIYNDLWLLRMSGHTEYKGDLHPVIRRYNDPRKLRTLKESLSLKFGMNFSTKKTRGFLASKILTTEELDAKLEKSKQKTDNTSSKETTRKKKADANPDETPVAEKKEQPLWRTDFDEYKRLFEEARKTVLADAEFRTMMEGYYPNIDFEKSIDRSLDYWMSEDGWRKCKSYRSQNIDPVKRLKNNFSKNKIYKSYFSGGNNRPQEYRQKKGQYDSFDVNEWNKDKN